MVKTPKLDPLVPRRKGSAPLPLAVRGKAAFIRPSTMIAPETFSHIENIKKRAGHLWRFL